MSRVLIVGATRGLGASLVKHYALSSNNTVWGTTRADWTPKGFPENINWACRVDLMKPEVGNILTSQLGSEPLDLVIISAGHFTTEDFDSGPNWQEELRMYTTSSIAPPAMVHALSKASLLKPNTTKILLVSSEAGSIGLRHESEGGGNYAHHASKSALNMVGKLLSLDLEDQGVAVGLVHPGFMRTEMTKNVGFDKYWDEGGAVTPEVAAKRLAGWAEKELDMSKTGELWAPGGPGDIGTAEVTMGKNLGTPLKLPW